MRLPRILAATILLVAACGPPTIAGFAVGERLCEAQRPDFLPNGTNLCDGYSTAARQTLDTPDPSHAAVNTTEVYGDPVEVTLGGYGVRSIVVLRLADGTIRAYRIQCGLGIDPNTCLDVTD